MDVTFYPGGQRAARVIFLRPSNFHAHFRRGAMMEAVAPHIMRHMRYVLAMPNTGPVVTMQDAYSYYDELMRIAAEYDLDTDFVMTLYFTDVVTPHVVEQIARSKIVRAVKWYPPHKGATTGSGLGIPLEEADETLKEMERLGVPLLGHFESVYDEQGRELPPEDREAYMVDHVLWRFRERYPNLLISFEHASTRQAVEFVKADHTGHTVMTVTPQHARFVSDDFTTFGTGLKCMPIVKTPDDRGAIVEFITSGDPRAIAGDDTAPHPRRDKDRSFAEAANGCWLPHSVEIYASVFQRAGALWGNFEKFMSRNGPEWWGLKPPDPTDQITLMRRKREAPEPVPVPGTDDVVDSLGWSEESQEYWLDFEIRG